MIIRNINPTSALHRVTTKGDDVTLEGVGEFDVIISRDDAKFVADAIGYVDPEETSKGFVNGLKIQPGYLSGIAASKWTIHVDGEEIMILAKDIANLFTVLHSKKPAWFGGCFNTSAHASKANAVAAVNDRFYREPYYYCHGWGFYVICRDNGEKLAHYIRHEIIGKHLAKLPFSDLETVTKFSVSPEEADRLLQLILLGEQVYHPGKPRSQRVKVNTPNDVNQYEYNVNIAGDIMKVLEPAVEELVKWQNTRDQVKIVGGRPDYSRQDGRSITVGDLRAMGELHAAFAYMQTLKLQEAARTGSKLQEPKTLGEILDSGWMVPPEVKAFVTDPGRVKDFMVRAIGVTSKRWLGRVNTYISKEFLDEEFNGNLDQAAEASNIYPSYNYATYYKSPAWRLSLSSKKAPNVSTEIKQSVLESHRLVEPGPDFKQRVSAVVSGSYTDDDADIVLQLLAFDDVPFMPL